jgi:hypothetical protein
VFLLGLNYSLIQNEGTSRETRQKTYDLRTFPDFFGAFAKLRKTATNFRSVRLSIRPHGTTWLRPKFYIWVFFENLSRKFKFHWNLTRTTGTLHENLRTFMTVTRWVLLRMRNVSDKSCRENQNTHFMFNNLFPKIVLFMRKCGKIWYSRTGHRQYNMAHALCVPDN